jgi:hypothetical protein
VASVYAVSPTPADIGVVPVAEAEEEVVAVVVVEGFLALSVIEPLSGQGHTPSFRREWECGPCTAHRHPRWKRKTAMLAWLSL